MKLLPLEKDCYYHFYNRGNNKENIFKEKENYYYFLKLMIKHISPICEIFSYCLLPNHFHLVFKIKDADELPQSFNEGKTALHQPFSNLFNAYTKAVNKKYDRTGSLFQKHPKRIKIEDDEYLKNLIIYVNTNSSHHSIADFEAYPFSSYQPIASNKPTFLFRKEVIELFEDLENFKQVLQVKNKTLND